MDSSSKMHFGKKLGSFLIALVSVRSILSASISCRSANITQFKPLFLTVLVLVPFPGDDFHPAFDQGYSIIPAVEIAVEQINKRTDILPIAKLKLRVRASGCDQPSKTGLESVKLLRELRADRQKPFGVIGPTCSEDSIFIANMFQRILNIPVFYSGTTPYLSENADDTPIAYGMISSNTVLIDALFKIADKEKWKWENIAVLYDETRESFKRTYNAFLRELMNNSQQVAGYHRQIADSQIPLREIIERNIRIVVVFSDKKPAHQLACLAGQSTVNFIFPIRQFIFIERSLEDFLGNENAEASFVDMSVCERYYCDKETVMRGLNGSVLLNQALDSEDPDMPTVSNYTVGQIKEQYKERLSEYGQAMDPAMNLKGTSFAYSYYDATWALAYGLHNAILNYSLPAVATIHEAIQKNVSFQGVSGWIEFKDSNDPHHVSNRVDIVQVNGSTVVLIGTRRNESQTSYNPNSFISDKFTTVMSVSLHPALVALGFLTTVLSFLFTVSLQLMNTFLRQYPSVKASSPQLNHFIFIGCYLLQSAIVISTVRHLIPEFKGVVLCNLDVIAVVMGDCLILSTIFAKSWRTYCIFSHPFGSHRFLRDCTLSILIGIFIIVQMLLILPFLLISPFQKQVSSVIDTSLFPPIRKLTTTCSVQSIGYMAFLLIFELFLTIATIFLATLNRNIRHTNFRTTRQILILVYILAIAWLLGGALLVMFYLLHYSDNIIYGTYTTLLVFTVFICQATLIVPALVNAVNAKCKARFRRRSWLLLRRNLVSLSTTRPRSDSTISHDLSDH